MKVLIKRDTKGGSIGKKPVLTWTTSNHFSFPQETLYPSSSTIISRQAYTVLASSKLIPTCRKLSGYKGGYKGVAVVGLISPAPGNPCKTNVSQKRRRSSSTSPTRGLLRSSANMNFPQEWYLPCSIDFSDGQFSERCNVDGSFFNSDAIPIIFWKDLTSPSLRLFFLTIGNDYFSIICSFWGLIILRLFMICPTISTQKSFFRHHISG